MEMCCTWKNRYFHMLWSFLMWSSNPDPDSPSWSNSKRSMPQMKHFLLNTTAHSRPDKVSPDQRHQTRYTTPPHPTPLHSIPITRHDSV